MKKRHIYLLATLSAGLLAGCGGGAGNDSPPAASPTPSNSVPAAAWSNIAAFFAFTGSLPASETALPLPLGDAVAPTSETAAPSPLS